MVVAFLCMVLALARAFLDLGRRCRSVLAIEYGLMLLVHDSHLLFMLGKQMLMVEQWMRLLRRHRSEHAVVEAEAHAVVAEELGAGFLLLLEELEVLVAAASVLGTGGGALIFVLVIRVVGGGALLGGHAL